MASNSMVRGPALVWGHTARSSLWRCLSRASWRCSGNGRPRVSGIAIKRIAVRKYSRMADPRIEPDANRFEVRVTADSHFAWVRTRAAVERTLMAWLRTAVSLIGFGFTIVQFLERMQELPGANPAVHPAAPRYLGTCVDFLWHPGPWRFSLA